MWLGKLPISTEKPIFLEIGRYEKLHQWKRRTINWTQLPCFSHTHHYPLQLLHMVAWAAALGSPSLSFSPSRSLYSLFLGLLWLYSFSSQTLYLKAVVIIYADHKQTLKIRATTLDTGSSSAMMSCRGRIS